MKANRLRRREILAGLVGGGIGALAPAPLEAAHPVRRHLAYPGTMEAAQAASALAEWSPALLSVHQNETLIALAERIVPGSTKAYVNRFVDRLLDVDSQETQQNFIASLSAFEAQALSNFGRPIIRLSPLEVDEVLEAAVASERERAEGQTDWGWFAVLEAHSPSEVLDLGHHLSNLKEWVSGAYYSSEIGMRELGWEHGVMHESFPGCPHPGGHE